MVKLICDKCGTELGTEQTYYSSRKYGIEVMGRDKSEASVYGGFRRDIHLCKSCEKDLDAFLGVE